MASVPHSELGARDRAQHGASVERIMEDQPHPEMGYRGCLGIIRLAKKYSNQRLEAAATRGLLTGAYRYPRIESMLRNSLDLQLPEATVDTTPPPTHDNIRGAEYFDQGESAC